MGEALGIETVITLAYDTNDADDWADLVEYAWGDAKQTSWGRRRAADGHPDAWNLTTFELGNEQYNPFFVDQVVAMEQRAEAVGAPPLRYMFPENGGLSPADAARLLKLVPGVAPRVLPDIHVGAGGAVGEARQLFAKPPAVGFEQVVGERKSFIKEGHYARWWVGG
jgi:alpha-N-arabinofuranosidase